MEGNNQKPMNIKIHKGFWTRDQVARDVDSIYVFGDNFTDFLDVYVPSSTQAVIRGLPNAYGISTKNDRFKYPKSYLSDEDGYVFRSSLEMVILLLKTKLEEGKTICFPEQGIGNGGGGSTYFSRYTTQRLCNGGNRGTGHSFSCFNPFCRIA